MYEGDRREWISDNEKGEAFALRLPEATRGYFFTNAVGVIDTIEFYEDSCYVKLPAYDRKMESIKEKYLGRKVIITQDFLGNAHFALNEDLGVFVAAKV